MTGQSHLIVGRFGWWMLAAVGAVVVTGSLLVVGPLGLPLLVCGVAVAVVGVATKKGAARRVPVIALGAMWFVTGVAVLLDSGTHTSVGGTGMVSVRGAGPSLRHEGPVGVYRIPSGSMEPTLPIGARSS